MTTTTRTNKLTHYTLTTVLLLVASRCCRSCCCCSWWWCIIGETRTSGWRKHTAMIHRANCPPRPVCVMWWYQLEQHTSSNDGGQHTSDIQTLQRVPTVWERPEEHWRRRPNTVAPAEVAEAAAAARTQPESTPRGCFTTSSAHVHEYTWSKDIYIHTGTLTHRCLYVHTQCADIVNAHIHRR